MTGLTTVVLCPFVTHATPPARLETEQRKANRIRLNSSPSIVPSVIHLFFDVMSSSTPLRSLRALPGQLQLRAAGPSTFRTRPLCPACLPRHLRRPTLAVRHASSSPSPLRAEASASTSSTSTSAFERAKRSAELSQAKMYAERAQKSRSVMLYGAGAVSPSLSASHIACCVGWRLADPRSSSPSA